MRLGVFGGTFNPVHHGHLAVARAVRARHGLDRVFLVPAGRPPHKGGELVSARHRLRMVELALEGEEGLEASDIEVRRQGPSYTADTLEEFARRWPRAELFFIVGADSLPELKGWRRVPRLFDLARVVVVNRPGAVLAFRPEDFPDVPSRALDRCREDQVLMEPRPESSSEVRRRLREGLAVADLVPPRVLKYLEAHRLYRT